MKVKYLGHSGFLLEDDLSYLLFDYYTGELDNWNAYDESKEWYVFVSHSHGDHFNKKILEICEHVCKCTYIFPTELQKKLRRKPELTDGRTIVYMKPETQETVGKCNIKTLPSTDIGVAYLVNICGDHKAQIYHGGDLNWWHWDGESKQYNNNMAANYKRYIDMLKDVGTIDYAFIPLDPRLGANYYLGMLYFIKNNKANNIYPMHFWDDPGVIDRFVSHFGEDIPDGTIIHRLE